MTDKTTRCATALDTPDVTELTTLDIPEMTEFTIPDIAEPTALSMLENHLIQS